MQSGGARIAIGVLLAVLIGGAAWMWLGHGASGGGGDFPDGIRMLCSDAACGKVYFTTIAEIARLRSEDDAAPIPCPACGSPGVRGRECTSCGGTFDERLTRVNSGVPTCPLCEKALPKLTE